MRLVDKVDINNNYVYVFSTKSEVEVFLKYIKRKMKIHTSAARKNHILKMTEDFAKTDSKYCVRFFRDAFKGMYTTSREHFYEENTVLGDKYEVVKLIPMLDGVSYTLKGGQIGVYSEKDGVIYVEGIAVSDKNILKYSVTGIL